MLYVASDFETAVMETVHHHAWFMAATAQPPGWTSQFREITLQVDAHLHDIRGLDASALLDPDDYATANQIGAALRGIGSDGLVYPSVRGDGDCVGLFFPDLAQHPVQGRHLDYHWNGTSVDMIRDATNDTVFRIVE